MSLVRRNVRARLATKLFDDLMSAATDPGIGAHPVLPTMAPPPRGLSLKLTERSFDEEPA